MSDPPVSPLLRGTFWISDAPKSPTLGTFFFSPRIGGKGGKFLGILTIDQFSESIDYGGQILTKIADSLSKVFNFCPFVV